MATDTADSMSSGSAPGSALQDFASQDLTPGPAPQDSTLQYSAPSQPTPPPPFYPPLFTIGDGDVVISIMPGPKNEIRISSTLLCNALLKMGLQQAHGRRSVLSRRYVQSSQTF